ncbi:MAG: DUF4177 domain-containing protein [Hymenobacter sp.]
MVAADVNIKLHRRQLNPPILTPNMKKFEYYILNAENSLVKGINFEGLQNKLNQLGSLGWEIFSTTDMTSIGSTSGLLIILKRELPG